MRLAFAAAVMLALLASTAGAARTSAACDGCRGYLARGYADGRPTDDLTVQADDFYF